VAGGGGRGLAGRPYGLLTQPALRREPNGTTESISQLGSLFARAYPLVASARIMGDVDQVFRFWVSFPTVMHDSRSLLHNQSLCHELVPRFLRPHFLAYELESPVRNGEHCRPRERLLKPVTCIFFAGMSLSQISGEVVTKWGMTDTLRSALTAVAPKAGLWRRLAQSADFHLSIEAEL